MMDVRIDSGIEVAIISVLRQLPRKIRIMMLVRQAAITAPEVHPELRRVQTAIDRERRISSPSGNAAAARLRALFTPSMISSVEDEPVF